MPPSSHDELDPGIELETGIKMLSEAEEFFRLGLVNRADYQLGLIQGSLEFFDEQKERGELTPKAITELATLHKLFDDTKGRILPG